MAEDEIIVIFEGYNKQGFKKFNNIEEIVQELIHSKEKLSITEEMLDEETMKNFDQLINKISELDLNQ